MEVAAAARSQNHRACAYADAAVRRSPTRRVRRAARRGVTRRRAPRAAAADAEEAECRRSKSSRRSMEQQQKIVFRDGAAGGFEPAPLNRRCLPETTSPPREAGASSSGDPGSGHINGFRHLVCGAQRPQPGGVGAHLGKARVVPRCPGVSPGRSRGGRHLGPEAKTAKKANDFTNCKSCHTRWSRYHRTGAEASDEACADFRADARAGTRRRRGVARAIGLESWCHVMIVGDSSR